MSRINQQLLHEYRYIIDPAAFVSIPITFPRALTWGARFVKTFTDASVRHGGMHATDSAITFLVANVSDRKVIPDNHTPLTLSNTDYQQFPLRTLICSM